MALERRWIEPVCLVTRRTCSTDSTDIIRTQFDRMRVHAIRPTLPERVTIDLTVLVIIDDSDGAARPLKIFQRSAAPVGGSVADISVIRSDVDGHRRR